MNDVRGSEVTPKKTLTQVRSGEYSGHSTSLLKDITCPRITSFRIPMNYALRELSYHYIETINVFLHIDRKDNSI